MDVTDNPVVRALLKQVLQTGQKVVAFLKGTLLTVRCAATRALLFLYDLTRVPFEWLDHWWGHAFDWVVGHAGDCCFDGAENFLFGETKARPAQRKSLRALEEGSHIAAEAPPPPQAAPASPSLEKQQQRRSSLFESSARGIVSRVTAAGHEVSERQSIPISSRMQNNGCPAT